MPARLDPFVDVMLRERADQLYLLPDEPVTLVKDGKPRKVSKQPLTDQHIYALMVEVAPPEAADKIDQQSETEFDYAGANGLVRVRIVPEGGRLTAVISAVRRPSQEGGAMPVVRPPGSRLRRRRRRGHRSSPPRRWWTVPYPRRATSRASSGRRSSRPPSRSSASCCAPSWSRAAPICISGSASRRCSGPTARSSDRLAPGSA